MSQKYPCPAGREDDCGYPACAHDRQCELAASACSLCGGLTMIPSDDPDGDIMNTPCPKCNEWSPDFKENDQALASLPTHNNQPPNNNMKKDIKKTIAEWEDYEKELEQKQLGDAVDRFYDGMVTGVQYCRAELEAEAKGDSTPPQEIREAALKIQRWMEENGHNKDWQFMGICSRSFATRPNIYKELHEAAERNDLMAAPILLSQTNHAEAYRLIEMAASFRAVANYLDGTSS